MTSQHIVEKRQVGIGALIVFGLKLYGILDERAERRLIADAARGDAPDPHGRRATSPSEIPKRGWWDILMRVKDDISQTNASTIAQGMAFSALLAIPSALTALVSLYGLVFDAGDVARQLQSMNGVLPGDVVTLVSEQLKTITSQPHTALGLGFIISLIVALWSTRSGTATLIIGLNVAYEEEEKRSFVWLQVITLGLTLAVIVFALLALTLIAVLPAIVGIFPLGPLGKVIATVAPWPVLIGLVMVALAAIYRYAPSRHEPRWRWVSWGAVLATALWIVGSALFSLYVGKFASYNKSYGSLGGVIVLLMWLYLSALVILIGAEMNAEIEHQTARDTTRGRPQRMGRRDARMADTLGKAA